MRTPLPNRPVRRRARLVGLGLSLVVLATCGDFVASPGADDERVIRGIRVPASSLELSDGDTVDLAATLVDQADEAFEEPPAGAVIEWIVEDSQVVAVEADGAAARIAGTYPGATRVTARAESDDGTADIAISVTVAPVPVDLAAVGGDEQGGTVGDTLAEPLAVRLVDRHDLPVPDAWISFDADEASGSLAPDSVQTDTTGTAAARWILDTVAGEQRASAAATGEAALDPVRLVAVARPGPVIGARITPAVDTLGVDETAQFTAAIVDEYGNPAAEADFAWSTADPAVATVDDAGLVTARETGEAAIVAASEEGTDTASVVVMDDDDGTPTGPDLYIASIDAEPDPAVLGRYLTVTAVIANGGVSSVPESAVAFEVLDGDGGGETVVVAETAGANPLGPEAADTLTATFVPRLGWPASVTIRAVADPFGTIDEADESNNSTATPERSVGPPDGDPYEPNDTLDTAWNIDDPRDPALDAADGEPGLPFATVSNDVYGTAAAPNSDVDLFRFSPAGDRLVTITAVTEPTVRLGALVLDSASGEYTLHQGLEFVEGTTRASINLEGGRVFYALIGGAEEAADAAPPYTLSLSDDAIVAHDYVDGDLSTSLEPNDLSALGGANRTAGADLPFDVLGSLDNGAGATPDLDFIRVPGSPGDPVEVLVRNDERDDTDATLTVVLAEPNDEPDGDPLTVIDQGFAASRGGIDTLTATLGTAPLYLGIQSLATGSDYDLCVRTTGTACRAELLAKTGGADQIDDPGETLAEPLEVTVSDAFERPVAGVPVAFVSDLGRVESPVVLSDENGIASTVYTLPDDASIPTVAAGPLGVAPVEFRPIAGRPDLRPTNISVEVGAGESGDSLLADVRVVNIGSAPSGPTEVEVRVVDAGTEEILASIAVPLGSITGDAAAEVTAGFEQGDTWPPTVFIDGLVDPDDLVLEGDETNNDIRSEPIVVP